MQPSLRASALLALALAGCGGSDERVNVLVVTLDTTRADRIGCYGNARIQTPNLDRLAAEGVLFESAFASSPSTLPSHCSIFTGQYPARHGVHDNGVYALGDDAKTLAERMSASGMRTAAFVSAFVLDRQFGLAQGFQHYDDEMELPLLEGDPEEIVRIESLPEEERRWLAQQASPYQRRADAVTRRALEWIERNGAEPFFLWVHYFDPHMDYTPPEPWDRRYDPDYAGELDGRAKTWHFVSEKHGWGRTQPLPEREREHMIARYDGELAFTDHWLGKLLDDLRARGLWERTLVVVVGDHGEGFGEHGQLWEHNGQIFDEVMRVPLILKLPGRAPAGRRVRSLARTIDVLPSVLDAAGLAPEPRAQGLSLLPLARGQASAPRPSEALLEALRERQSWPTDFSWLGLRTEAHKLVLLFDKRGEIVQRALFDLGADPGERRDSAGERPSEVEEWTGHILEGYRRMQAEAGSSAFRGMDSVTSDALKALGYAGSSD